MREMAHSSEENQFIQSGKTHIYDLLRNRRLLKITEKPATFHMVVTGLEQSKRPSVM